MADLQQYATTLFTGMLRESGMPVTETEMRAAWNGLNADEGSLIRNDSSYSPFWRLISAIVTRPALWLVELLVRHVLPNSFLRFASGVYLDLYAWGVHLTRKGSGPAIGRVIFTRNSPGGETPIPVGTFVETPPINGRVYRVRTTEAAVIPNGHVSVAVPVEAEEHGEAWNLGPGYYSLLSQTVNGIASVTNPEGWLEIPGADVEEDEPFRLRCRNQFAAVGQLHHDAAYKAVISAFTGIRIDYLFFDARRAVRGPGTSDCYILVESGVPPQTLCDAINVHVMDEGNHGHGDDLLCRPIRTEPVDLTVTVHPRIGLSAKREQILLEETKNRIRCAFRQNTDFPMTKTLPLSRFSFSRLGDELHDALPDLASVEFHRGEDILARLWLPVLAGLDIRLEEAA